MKVLRALVVLVLFLLSCSDAARPTTAEATASFADKLTTTAGLANLALGRPTRQSSTVGGRASQLVVDGNTDGNWYNGGVTHTNLDTEAWWEVDLGSLRYIEAVRVFGRTDCCQDRLSHYFVYISETPIIGNNPFAVTPATGYTPESFAAERWTDGVPDTVVFPGSRKRGRYVRIYVPGPQYLSLAEVEVWGAISVTEGRFLFPTQSGDAGLNAPAYLAIDNNPNGDFWAPGGGSVTHSDLVAQAWWQIDLGAVYQINAVDVWGRTDCCSERLSNFAVFVSEDPFVSTDYVATIFQPGMGGAGYTGSPPPFTPATLNINATGRYVRVQLTGTNILSLAEVRIWGLPRLGLGAPAWQTTTVLGAEAGRALDGNHNGAWSGGSVTHTDYQGTPWWWADLGTRASMGLIRVWNRTDCCSARLDDFVFADVGGAGSYLHWGAAGPVTDIRPMSIQDPTATYPSITNSIGPMQRPSVFLGRTDILSLAEVEMFGQPVSQCGLVGGHCCAEEGQEVPPCSGNLVCRYNTCGYPYWPASTDYTDRLGDPAAPANWAQPWTEELQGVAHSATDWYFTNTQHIYKMPLNGPVNRTGNPYSQIQLFAAAGFHYGDPSYYRNVSTWADPIGHEGLLVPIETNAGHYVALLNPSLTQWWLWGPFPGNLAWLAVNPADGLLYLPKTYYDLTQIDGYRIQWPTNGTPFDLVWVKTIELHSPSGGTPDLPRVQGGEFSQFGHLYVVSWNCLNKWNGGVYGFDTNGMEMMHHAVDYVLPGSCSGPPYLGDEVEGIDVVDLDSTYPDYGGQIHVIKVDVHAGTDSFYFSHIKVPQAVKWKL